MKRHIGGLGVLIALFVIAFHPLKAEADDWQGRRISVSDRFLVSRDFDRVTGQKPFAPWGHHEQRRLPQFGHHRGFTQIIVVNPPPVVIEAPKAWVPPQWVWNGWEWVWMPGYWTW